MIIRDKTINGIAIKYANDSRDCELHEDCGMLYYTFPRLDETGICKNLFMTRLGGVSKAQYSESNFSYTRGDDPRCVDENYSRVSDILGLGHNTESFVTTYQTHTSNVRVITVDDKGKGTCRQRDYVDVDGMITNERGIVLTTFHADCPVIYFVDPVQKCIGLAHSGWRGTRGQIGRNMVTKMAETYGSKPGDIICAIGPSVCQDCYEISKDVADEFYHEFGREEIDHEKILIPYPNEKYHLSLWGAIRLTLLHAGIHDDNILMTNVCTCCNPHVFFSHRIQHDDRGNLAAFLTLN